MAIAPPTPQPADPMVLLQAQKHKDQGNRHYALQQYDLAAGEYRQAIDIWPGYTDAYYNLGKVYHLLGQDDDAINAFQHLVALTPDDHEARTFLAERYSDRSDFRGALREYRTILDQEPSFDPAFRNYQYAYVQQLATSKPEAAQRLYSRYSEANLHQAKGLAKEYFELTRQPILAKLSAEIPYQFAPTQSVQGNPNLAEYDYYFAPPQGLIRLSPELAFAHPNVLAAYMVHELIHANDRDPLTSITEEQDGYWEQARFWSMYKGDVLEPNLDLAVRLGRESKARLDRKVWEVYSQRGTLPDTSPGHGMPRIPLSEGFLKDYQLSQLATYSNFFYEQMKNLLPAAPLRP